MTSSPDLHLLTIEDAAPLLAARKLSPVELVDAFLANIAAVDSTLHSYVTVLHDEACSEARRAEAEIMAGRYRGPLHGIPYALKDNIMVRGVRTAANSRLMLDHMSNEDATVHRRLAEAGAVLLGKLNTFEYGTGTGNGLFELPFPPARNPWDLDRFPGGSTTGGGVSVAAGTAMLAIGTDTGGSVRLPAAACGAAGLKPTYGLISRAGILPNCWSLDTVGPICWTAGSVAHTLHAIAGFDPGDPASVPARTKDHGTGLNRGLHDVQIAVIRRFHERDSADDAEIACAFDDSVNALRALGATIVETDFAPSLFDFRTCSRLINAAECHAVHEQDFIERRTMMGAVLRDKLTLGACVGAADYLRAQRWRRALAAQVQSVFAAADLIVCAGATRRAPAYRDQAGVAAFTTESAMSVFSLSGHPAISVCNGFSADGLPLNLQLAGRHFDEPTVLAAASALEAALGLKTRRPNLVGKVPLDPAPDRTATPYDDGAAFAASRAAVAATVAKMPGPLPRSLEPSVIFSAGSHHAAE